MVEPISEIVTYAAQNPSLTGLAVGSAPALRSFYHQKRSSGDYEELASTKSDEELVEELDDLYAGHAVRDMGCEAEGSPEEFFAIADPFFRPRRAAKKNAYMKEAKQRGLKVEEVDGEEFVTSEQDLDDLEDNDEDLSYIDQQLDQYDGELLELEDAEVDERIEDLEKELELA